MLVAQVASLSRGGGAAFAVGLGVLVLLTVYARFFGRQMGLWTRSGALLVLLASAAALGAAFLPADIAGSAAVRYQGILNPTTDATGAFRLRLWDAGYRMLAQSPFLGVGPGAFGLALVASGAFSVPWEAHSSLVEIAVETGYVGLLVVGLALVVGALYSAAAFNAASRDGSVEIGRVALASGLMASAAAIVTGGFSLSNILYQPLFATTIVLLIATLARQEPAQ
jgi:O-antigen ligase